MYNYHTSCKHILGDLHTPVGVYMKLRDVYPQSALMESSDYHGGENSRSFIAIHPIASVRISHGKAIAAYPDGTSTERDICKDYMSDSAINDFLHQFSVSGDNANYCGLYGYTSFNAVRYFENINIKDETQARNDAPDLLYILFKDVIVFDHFNNTMTLVEMLADNEPDGVNKLLSLVGKGNAQAYDFRPVGPTTSPLTDEQHKANISQGIAHCKRGDVFQIVLSRRFVQKYEGDDFKLYRALRSINPRPTCSISTSEASASSAPRPRRTAASRAARPTSTPSPAPPSARAIPTPTARMPSICATTPRRMPNT
jgi:anthranilate synthase component 1